MGRGRRPGGPEQVERLEGTPEAKRRLRVILETVAGTKGVAEACEELGIREARFHELRDLALQGAAERLEARAAGRPRKEEAPETARVKELEQENRELKLAVQAARVREEIAVGMAHLMKPREEGSKKKGAADHHESPGLFPEAAPDRLTPQERHEAGHAKRLRGAWEAKTLKEEGTRRGRDRQLRRRELEREIQKSALVFRRLAMRLGVEAAVAAQWLGLAVSTLAGWARGWEEDRLKIELRGRPIETANRTVRELILAIFRLMGPGVGLPTLQKMFPWTSRAVLEDLILRYRYVCRKKSRMLVHVLKWLRPGAVWAMDFKQAPVPVDGVYLWVLAVRDLASGMMLLTMPMTRATSEMVRGALEMLFRMHGAPLVIKSDNGSPFKSKATKALLETYRVWLLLSPPGTPPYNGGIEAGIGGMTTRAHLESFRQGRPGEWTCDDLEGARLMANLTARPQGLYGPTPEEAWSPRLAISEPERADFALAVALVEAETRAEKGYLPGMPVDPDEQDAIDRIAISRALIDRDYLTFRRRVISLPIRSFFRKKIS